MPPADMRDTVFYDGHCGLCDGATRFLLRRDPDGSRFVFAPLRGSTIRNRLKDEQIAKLPDSMVVQLPTGKLLLRSDGVAHLLRRLGGGWGVAGRLLRLIPRPVRDAGYNLVARTRHRLFPPADSSCPTLPEKWRARFLP